MEVLRYHFQEKRQSTVLNVQMKYSECQVDSAIQVLLVFILNHFLEKCNFISLYTFTFSVKPKRWTTFKTLVMNQQGAPVLSRL